MYVCVSYIIDGDYWGTWESWDGCTVTCGEGSQSRTRMCMKNALPQNHWCYKLTDTAELQHCHYRQINVPCSGDQNESRVCSPHQCPGNMYVCIFIVRSVAGVNGVCKR